MWLVADCPLQRLSVVFRSRDVPAVPSDHQIRQSAPNEAIPCAERMGTSGLLGTFPLVPSGFTGDGALRSLLGTPVPTDPGVPAVPWIPRYDVELGAVLFAQICSTLWCGEVPMSLPPQLDDVSTRVINRLGGWNQVTARWRGGSFSDDVIRFFALVSEFVEQKRSGFYMTDKLPYLRGAAGSTRAARLSRSWIPGNGGNGLLPATVREQIADPNA